MPKFLQSAPKKRTQTLRFDLSAALGLGILALTACETGPVYKPRGPGDAVGYTDRQIAPNRYRVSFSGGTGTRREDVEDFLLRRAAEVTVASGYQYFTFEDRDTERETYYRTIFDTWDHTYGYLGTPYAYRPYYWSSWAFPPTWSRADAIPVNRYTAYSEIVMLTPQQAMNNPDAIPARDVLARLMPRDGEDSRG